VVNKKGPVPIQRFLDQSSTRCSHTCQCNGRSTATKKGQEHYQFQNKVLLYKQPQLQDSSSDKVRCQHRYKVCTYSLSVHAVHTSTHAYTHAHTHTLASEQGSPLRCAAYKHTCLHPCTHTLASEQGSPLRCAAPHTAAHVHGAQRWGSCTPCQSPHALVPGGVGGR